MIGPFANPLEDGAMGIFTTREAAEEFVRGDPVVRHGVVRNWTIREWNEALVPNEPGVPAPAPASAPSGWRDILPELSAEPYVFAAAEAPPGVTPFAVIREDEGVTLVLTRADADRAGLDYDYVAARITARRPMSRVPSRRPREPAPGPGSPRRPGRPGPGRAPSRPSAGRRTPPPCGRRRTGPG